MFEYYKCYVMIELMLGIDVNQTSASRACDICHYWYFLNYSNNFE